MGDFDRFHSELSRFRDEVQAGAAAESKILTLWPFGIHSRATVGRPKVCFVVDVHRGLYFDRTQLQFWDPILRVANSIQASLNDWLESGRRRLRPIYDTIIKAPPDEPSEASAVVLLSLVYQYLTGNVDLGSCKAYSRSSLDFRDIYVAVVLFLGAYVWIKFREVAFKEVHERKIVDKRHGRITKVVFEPRFKPPRENNTVLQWIYLGQYATPEEASILYQVAAFYYNESQGQGGSLDLEDGRWFPIPPMSEGERSLTGADKRSWVKVQAMKVYEDFRKEKAEAALLQALLEACEDEGTASQAVDPCESSLLNSTEHQPPLLVSHAENSAMATTGLGVQGLECASQSFGGMHEGFVTSNVPSLGFQEESAIPIPQLTPDAQSGMGINNSNQLNLLQIVHNQQELITYQQQRLEELGAQISVLQNQQRIQQ